MKSPSLTHPAPGTYGRLGTEADLDRQSSDVRQHGGKIDRDDESGTVTATMADGTHAFRAIRKGNPGQPWIVAYNPAVYPKADAGCVRPVRAPQSVAGHSVRILCRVGANPKSPGERCAEIDGTRRVPVDILRLAAGPDAWMGDITVRCLDCGKRVSARELESAEVCGPCYDAFDPDA